MGDAPKPHDAIRSVGREVGTVYSVDKDAGRVLALIRLDLLSGAPLEIGDTTLTAHKPTWAHFAMRGKVRVTADADYQQWLAYLTTQQVRTWLLWVKGTPAGYIELLKQPDQSVEIKFFGLLPQFIGQGLGASLANAAVMLAAQWTTGKIWLHTCSADHPSALKNYQHAGFVITHTETSVEALPELNDSRLLTQEFVYSALTYHIENAG